jgi:hypothetical protein
VRLLFTSRNSLIGKSLSNRLAEKFEIYYLSKEIKASDSQSNIILWDDLINWYKSCYTFNTIGCCITSTKLINELTKYIEQKENKIVVHSVIDNLLKGAVGQAVQNMNLMMGLEETLGIQLKASNF